MNYDNNNDNNKDDDNNATNNRIIQWEMEYDSKAGTKLLMLKVFGRNKLAYLYSCT